MSAPARFLPRLRPLVPRIARVPRGAFVTSQSQTGPAPIEPSQTQAHPLGAYYDAILNDPQPIPDVKPEEPPNSSIHKQEQGRKTSPPSPSPSPNPNPTTEPVAEALSAQPVPTPPPQTAAEKAAIVFGSALAGPAARQKRLEELRSKSTTIAGVVIPPRPEEPDNCCMSGCVNCVWERYREEMEDWSAANAEAQLKLKEQQGASANDSNTMDDDGGGSDTNWVPQDPKIAKNMWDEKLYDDVPVGIREFMKTEKKLKAVHEKEGTTGG
ncbi:oxidoreductase-like protein [Colletotrichum paranaense]|uniref:Oxidoreductase-like protein n=6 Tax=Colletotrichum acutatum species complex TaxID=2707335 RepID=A0A9Q0AXF8_9PEZI|nr:oxidoreductase-like protein [Colletotrichum costaricense]XP_060355559.1 oxidoreductase-like protein [Colletotrichum paranaense]XP_060376388.1 oxidoreductase-like protein [Colletotrichum tamarilloi]XP_060403426.1 oxidoreductase-like protein [Colletotrichum abscissum]KAI3528173.1 oxidoreductase-like protein [Colletotrichum filicis]KAK0381120.1 oxidoreductase-like protein [Colletotrichum limetticola]KAK1449335.1 oxidoreductase-like protein [Colletotrichum melonis]KAK1714003.1 oxidoreductase-